MVLVQYGLLTLLGHGGGFVHGVTNDTLCMVPIGLGLWNGDSNTVTSDKVSDGGSGCGACGIGVCDIDGGLLLLGYFWR